MKAKWLNLGLLLSSLLGYLEWGGDNHMFLFEGELDVIVKLFTDPAAVLHPFTILPLTGQILLIITLFQREPGKVLTIIGMVSIGILLTVVLLAGILSLNIRTILSILPYMFISYLVIIQLRRRKPGVVHDPL